MSDLLMILIEVSRHNRGKSKYTKKGIPWILVYAIQFDSIRTERKAERKLKSLKSRKIIKKLINREMNWTDINT